MKRFHRLTDREKAPDGSAFSAGAQQFDTPAMLRAIDAKLDRILAAVERPSPKGSKGLTRADRDALARLLPAAAGVFGSEKFLTRDLFESEAVALRLVLRGLNALNAKSVGKLLGRAVGEPIDAYMVTRDGTELNATLWRIVRY